MEMAPERASLLSLGVCVSAVVAFRKESNTKYPVGSQYLWSQKKGMLVDGWPGVKVTRSVPVEANPYVWIKITDANYSDIQPYLVGWRMKLDFSQVWNLTKRGYRVTAWATNTSNSEHDRDYGRLSRSLIENYIEGWNGLVRSATTNQVVFDVGILGLSSSDKYWDQDVSSLDFSEYSYNSTTHVMRILLDSSGSSWPFNKVVGAIEDNGLNIVSQDSGTKQILFAMPRDIIISEFKNECYMKFLKSQRHAIKSYYISESDVDDIITAGRSVDKTFDQFKAMIKSYLTD